MKKKCGKGLGTKDRPMGGFVSHPFVHQPLGIPWRQDISLSSDCPNSTKAHKSSLRRKFPFALFLKSSGFVADE
jgi:hypothetical protein